MPYRSNASPREPERRSLAGSLAWVAIVLGLAHASALLAFYPAVYLALAAGDGWIAMIVRMLAMVVVLVIAIVAAAFLAPIASRPLHRAILAGTASALYVASMIAISRVTHPLIVYPRAGDWHDVDPSFADMLASAWINPGLLLCVLLGGLALKSVREHRRARMRLALAGPCPACGSQRIDDAAGKLACAACGADVPPPDEGEIDAFVPRGDER